MLLCDRKEDALTDLSTFLLCFDAVGWAAGRAFTHKKLLSDEVLA